MLIDTHAHIHFDDYTNELAEIFTHARTSGVGAIITIGTNELDSTRAIEFTKATEVINQAGDIKLYATVGLHPHDAKRDEPALSQLRDLLTKKNAGIVAVGECGLDYYRNLSPKDVQIKLFQGQIELALEHDLPLVFHVRDAWEDFFRILTSYPKIRGVIHSFTGSPAEVEQGMKHDLYFALNGIITFTKLDSQLAAARRIPDDKLLLETDSPFLSPTPNRGQRNEPANVALIAEFLARLRGSEVATIANITTANAKQLFSI